MIGKILSGRYELLEKVGTGGMAVVYKAKCLLLNRIVAVKILRNDLDSSDEFLKRFNIEAQSAASLTNQHIVSIYDVGIDGDTNYIVMEYVEGETLKEYIKYNRPVSWKLAVKIAMQISDALSEAHRKHIVHRDIKPQNIIITEDGNIKVTDFGIARVSSGATISVDGDVLGSVHYLSPEQARGGYVDERSDIYSLGVVMYEMLTGKVPFDGETPVAVAMKQIEQPPVPPCEIVNDIPETVSTIVLKAMSKEVSGRYNSTTELYDDLSKVLSDPNSVVISLDKPDFIDEATKKIPPIKIDTLNLEVDNTENKVATNEKKKISDSDKKTIIGALITSVVIVALLSMFAANIIFPDFKPFGFLSSFSNQEVEVPDLLNKSLEEAKELVKDTEFSIVEKGSKEDSDTEPGTIIEQYPKAGRIVKGAQTIEVVVAKDGDGIKMKNYENMQYETVESQLKSEGFKVEIERIASDGVAKDYIISHSPAADITIKEGETIILYVSDGIEVPDLSGKTKKEAIREIEQRAFTVGEFLYKDSSKPKDTVIKQTVNKKDSKVIVDLILSNGEGGGDEESDVPSNNPTSSEKKEKTLFITLPTDREKVTVKITSNGSVVYEGTQYPQKDPDFAKTVSGTGNVTFEIYIDGTKVASQNVNFGN